MKNLVISAICLLALGACSHSERKISSEKGGLAAIADYFNQSAMTDSNNQEERRSDVLVRDGKLVAPTADTNNNFTEHAMEDCRRQSIRQAMLDATGDGYSVVEISRKGSHRLRIMGSNAGYEDDRVGAMVGLKIQRGGKPMNATFIYNLDDDSSGTCVGKNSEGMQEGFEKRKDVEEMVLKKIFPTLSEKEKAEVRESMKHYFKGDFTDQQMAEKSVGKLVEWECEQMALSKSAVTAQEAFRMKFGSQPILFLDYRASRVNSNLNDDTRSWTPKRKYLLDKMEGFYAYRMADATGKNLLSAKVSFSLREKEESCEGNVDAKAELIP